VGVEGVVMAIFEKTGSDRVNIIYQELQNKAFEVEKGIDEMVDKSARLTEEKFKIQTKLEWLSSEKEKAFQLLNGLKKVIGS
jgi:hypothetical protein